MEPLKLYDTHIEEHESDEQAIARFEAEAEQVGCFSCLDEASVFRVRKVSLGSLSECLESPSDPLSLSQVKCRLMHPPSDPLMLGHCPKEWLVMDP